VVVVSSAATPILAMMDFKVSSTGRVLMIVIWRPTSTIRPDAPSLVVGAKAVQELAAMFAELEIAD
jgi:hypothetical protein